jgi:hypothetical protein
MKIIVVGALCLVLGLMVGFGASRMMTPPAVPVEPESVQAPEPAAAPAEVAEQPARSRRPGPEVARDEQPAPELLTMEAPAAGSTNAPSERDLERARMREEGRARWEEFQKMTPEQRQAMFASNWYARVSTVRSNVLAEANIDSNKAVKFDVIVAAMNMRLQQVLDPYIQKAQGGVRLTTQERTRMTYDVSGVMVTTYDELNRNVPELQASSNTANFRVTSMVDPQYLQYTHDIGGGRDGFRGGPPGGGGPGGQRGGNTGGGNTGGQPR